MGVRAALDMSGPVHAAFLKPVASRRAADPFVLAKREHMSRKIVRIASTVALGGFLVGFDAAVISGAVPFIRDYFDLGGSAGSLKLGWAVSCLGWGAMAGNLAAGPLSDRYGRRSVLLFAAILFLASSLTAASSTSFPVFVAARICGGLGVGTAILTAPVYIAEIAPARSRGALVSLNQLMIVIGISVSFFSNYFLLSLGAASWRWMLGVQAVPATLYFLLLTMVPESPRWLLTKGRDEGARAALAAVHGPAVAHREYELIQANPIKKSRRFSLRELLTGRLKGVMVFGLGIAFFQQATGINAIFYYLPSIFAQSGGGLSTAFAQSVLVGLVNVGMTFVAIWLIDRLGRKPLLGIGLTGATVSLLTIAWAFHAANLLPGAGSAVSHEKVVLIAIIAYVASFAISLGPVMWVMLSEIFPNEERAAAISVVGFWNSLVSASVTLLFPIEVAVWGPAGTFLAYGLLAAAGLVFVVMLAPETKGKTPEELEGILTQPKQVVGT
jgi:sugar porter (SP) family MFS transporter